MVQFNALEKGQILWRKVTTQQGGTKLRAIGCTPITILDVDKRSGRVQAQWGTNPPRWYSAEVCNGWLRSRPKGLKEAVFTSHALRRGSA